MEEIRKGAYVLGDTFEICVDKRDNAGRYLYVVCYEDKNSDKILDEIWINGENYSLNESFMYDWG